MSESAIRARFEEWARQSPREWDVDRFGSDESKTAFPKQYRVYFVQAAWEAWQEASNYKTAFETLPDDYETGDY
jgi:hypothetical protein